MVNHLTLFLLGILLMDTGSLVSVTSATASKTASASAEVVHSHAYTDEEIFLILKDPKDSIPADVVDRLGDFQFEDDFAPMGDSIEDGDAPGLRGGPEEFHEDRKQQQQQQENRELGRKRWRVTTRTGTGNHLCNMCDDGGVDPGPFRICRCSAKEDGHLCRKCWGRQFKWKSCDRFCRVGYP